MILFPHCKINLGLRILGQRQDGYHDIETIFYPVFGLRDVLEMLPAAETSIQITGLDIPGDTNLCVRAHALLSADFPAVRPVAIYLHKHIPIGAGLGGGSSDGAFALLLLNRLFRLGLTREQLLPYASALGSDCPFFLFDGPCRATGRGEILEPVIRDLSGNDLVLVNPGIHVPTAWAFAQVHRRAEDADNDFEPAVFSTYPEIGHIKETLLAGGAVYASMSGSGSTVYGLFKPETPTPEFPPHYWVARF